MRIGETSSNDIEFVIHKKLFSHDENNKTVSIETRHCNVWWEPKTDENCQFCADLEVRRERKKIESAKFAFNVCKCRGVSMLFPRGFFFQAKMAIINRIVSRVVRGLSG